MPIVSQLTSGGDSECCNWCNSDVHLSDLTGWGSNQCPHCGNPMMKATFGALGIGTVFCCENGGKWVKFDPEQAVCVEEDNAFYTGETNPFSANDVAYPY